jgi:hypothetical protein
MSDDAITVPVARMAQMAGLSEWTIWGMISRGELESVAVGRRRLVIVDSYRRLIEERRGQPADCRRNTAVPAAGERRARK